MVIDVNKPFKLIDLVLVKRREWQALPPTSVEEFGQYPIYWMVESFTDTEECYTREDCSRVLQQLQRREMAEGLPDIRYNFMIGGDWAVYEGRGWKHIPDLRPPYDEKDKRICVHLAYVGPEPRVGQRNYPIMEMKHAMDLIIDYGINQCYLDSNFNLGTQDRHFMAVKHKPIITDL